MSGIWYVYWQESQFWYGYLEEFPDYPTHSESLEDLRQHLRDLLTICPAGTFRACATWLSWGRDLSPLPLSNKA